MTYGGYMGSILYVNLTNGRTSVQELDPTVARKYLGGTGLAAYFMRDFAFGKIDPLGEENPLIFSTGPFTGTSIPTSGRYAVVAKSPLTGIWGESDSGGYFGSRLKGAGYDCLVVTGKSSVPAKLVIDEESVNIEEANDLWGLDTYETVERLQGAYGKRAGVVSIGPAGEKQISMANIMAEGKHARAAGRCGLGAVMGSKNLKAIICRGNKKANIVDKNALKDITRRVTPGILAKSAGKKKLGTAGGVTGNAVLADMSAKNWVDGDWAEPSEKINGEVLKRDFFTGNYNCPTCIVGCGKTAKVKSGPFTGTESGAPEYETIAGFGAQCLVTDPKIIVEANDLCNRLGIDTISTSSTIAFAMEAVERGLLKAPEEIPNFTWGNGKAVIGMINLIAEGRSLGALLGQGVKRVSEIIGGGSEAYAIHSKGLEFPFHDPRALKSLAVAYATSPRGGCHRWCSHSLERFAVPDLGYEEPLDRFADVGKGIAVAKMQNYADLFNCLKLCQFIMGQLRVSDITDWLNAVTGWDVKDEELLTIGERNLQLKRMLNVSCGISRKDDSIPFRIMKEPFISGTSKGEVPNLDLMLIEYYSIRGWDENGIPKQETLERLDL